jgi:hypothetical protein
MNRKRTAIVSFAVILVAVVFWLRPVWRSEPKVQLIFEGQRPVTYGKRTNYLAVFRLANAGGSTIYYEGTPYPVYIIEQKEPSGWNPDAKLPEPEVLCPIFPGKNYHFTIPCPMTSNAWRVAVSVVAPSRAPLLLRRYFKPRHLVCRSSEILREEFAGGNMEGEPDLIASPAVR